MELLWVIWLLCFIACAVIGGRKGNLIGAMFLGLVLGPLALIIVAASADKNKKTCKFCAMGIPIKATTCPYCRKDQILI